MGSPSVRENGGLAGYVLKVKHFVFPVGLDVGCTNFDALVKVMCLRFFHCKCITFPFCN